MKKILTIVIFILAIAGSALGATLDEITGWAKIEQEVFDTKAVVKVCFEKHLLSGEITSIGCYDFTEAAICTSGPVHDWLWSNDSIQ